MTMVRTKSDPHHQNSRQAPAPTNPINPPVVVATVQTADAWDRLSAGNVVVKMVSVTGKMSAAPTPMKALTAISSVGLPASAATADVLA